MKVMLKHDNKLLDCSFEIPRVRAILVKRHAYGKINRLMRKDSEGNK